MAQLKNIGLDALDLPDDAKRTAYDPESLQELAGSLEEVGLLQPIAVREDGKRYIIIAGTRRYLACRLLKWKTIAAFVHKVDAELDFVMRVIENLQREQLAPIDEAQAVRTLVDTYGLGIEQSAKRLRKSPNWIRARLDLLRLPEPILEAVQREEISQGVAFELGKIENEPQRDVLLGYAVEAGCTREQAAKWREQFQRPTQPYSPPPINSSAPPPPSQPPQPTNPCMLCEQDRPEHELQYPPICIGCGDIMLEAIQEYVHNHPETFHVEPGDDDGNTIPDQGTSKEGGST